MHKFLTILLSAIVSVCHTPTYTQVIDRAQSSVIRITGEMQVMTMIGPQTATYVCSGEVIALNRVLTAGHCVGDQMLADGSAATVLKVDKKYDLALLGVVTDKPALTLRDTPVVRFESLSGIGYAWGWNRLTVVMVKPFLVDYTPEQGKAPGIFVQGGYIGGMSGGPVVDASGLMVGIVQEGNEGIGFGVGTLLIHAFILGV